MIYAPNYIQFLCYLITIQHTLTPIHTIDACFKRKY